MLNNSEYSTVLHFSSNMHSSESYTQACLFNPYASQPKNNIDGISQDNFFGLYIPLLLKIKLHNSDSTIVHVFSFTLLFIQEVG